MEQPLSHTPPTRTSRGRWWFALGAAACVLGLVLYGIQFSRKEFVVPWYAPVLGTAGVLLMALAWRLRPTVWRVIGLGLFTLLVAGEWYFLLSLSKLPAYTGPARAGEVIPRFTTTRADGRPFTDRDLQQGSPTVLLFFRGRW
jgi:hypothetical protein